MVYVCVRPMILTTVLVLAAALGPVASPALSTPVVIGAGGTGTGSTASTPSAGTGSSTTTTSGGTTPVPQSATRNTTTTNAGQPASVRVATGFSGSDIGAQINAAIADLPESGGEVYIPDGAYAFSSPIRISRDVILRGAGDGFGPYYGTKLMWAGKTDAVITVAGSNVEAGLRDFAIDNSGTAAVGIDIDGLVNRVSLEHITIYPQSAGFGAGVRIGNTANVVDVLLRDVWIRNNLIGVQVLHLNGGLTLDHAHLIQNTVNDLVLGVKGGFDVVDVSAVDTMFDGAANTTMVSVMRAKKVSFVNCYFEHDGAGYAIDIPNSSVYGWSVTVEDSAFFGGAVSHATPYAINIANKGTGTLNVLNSYFGNYANPGFAVRNESSTRILMMGNDLDFQGAGLVNHDTNVTAISNHVVSGNMPDRFSSAVLLTGEVSIGGGVDADGAGLKHGRASTGNISARSGASVQVSWKTAFRDPNYTVNCSVVEPSASNTLRVHHIQAVDSGSILVWVVNSSLSSAYSGTLNCLAVHD